MKSVAQPVVQENCNWTGFYIGALVGYQRSDDLVWTDTDTSIAPQPGADTEGVSSVTHTSQSGFLAGGELGFNYQLGHFVFGAEGDFASSEARGVRVKYGSPNTEDFATRNDWLGSAGLRIGYSYRQFLFYVKVAPLLTTYGIRGTTESLTVQKIMKIRMWTHSRAMSGAFRPL